MPYSTRLLVLLAFLATACTQSAQHSAEGASAETANGTKGLKKKAGWWKEAIVYQLYPRSFQDSNGDGIGYLKGILQRLDYLKGLGIETVWLNPIYASPNDDNGYDISDYQNIMPDFGTMADFDALLKGMHQHGLKLVMDIVVNHSSDEHKWFKQARSSRTSPYRNYYYWWPAEKGTPPARYSTFDVKKNAWQYDSVTNSYYLHYFSKKQPDLNWNNPKVRHEVYNMMRFWADKGVDGFRMNAFQFVAKDPSFPPMPGLTESNYTNAYNHGPHLHDYLQLPARHSYSQAAPVLVYGDYQLLDKDNSYVWAYTRTRCNDQALVVLNFSATPQRWALPAGLAIAGDPWLNNYPTLALGPTLALQPWQAVVVPLR